MTNILGMIYRDGSILAKVPSAKWIFDAETKKCRAVILHDQKTKIMLKVLALLLIGRLRPTVYNFTFTFPEWLFMIFASTTPKHLYLG
jgi:hypothetical protein